MMKTKLMIQVNLYQINTKSLKKDLIKSPLLKMTHLMNKVMKTLIKINLNQMTVSAFNHILHLLGMMMEL